MKSLSKFAVPVITATALIGLSAAPASAATTTVREDSATGAPFSGDYRITNVGDLTFSGSIFTASCTTADLVGGIQSDGTGSLDAGSTVTGCTSSLGAAAVTFNNLPYTQGQLTYGPVNGYDGTLVFSDPTLEIEAQLGSNTCTYGLDEDHPNLTFYIRNPDNANNVTGELEGEMVDASLGLIDGSFLCPGDVQANALGKALGHDADTGDYTQTLYITS